MLFRRMQHMQHLRQMELQPKATSCLLTSFYNPDITDDSLVTYAPMDFNVKLGFSSLAKNPVLEPHVHTFFENLIAEVIRRPALVGCDHPSVFACRMACHLARGLPCLLISTFRD